MFLKNSQRISFLMKLQMNIRWTPLLFQLRMSKLSWFFHVWYKPVLSSLSNLPIILADQIVDRSHMLLCFSFVLHSFFIFRSSHPEVFTRLGECFCILSPIKFEAIIFSPCQMEIFTRHQFLMKELRNF